MLNVKLKSVIFNLFLLKILYYYVRSKTLP